MRADLTCESSSSDSVKRGKEGEGWRKDEKGERKEEGGELIADITHMHSILGLIPNSTVYMFL